MRGYRTFTSDLLDDLLERARASERKRQHLNLHESFEEPCQRLFNAMMRDSYVRPHRHNASQGPETIIAVRGKLALLLFDDGGTVTAVESFGAEGESGGAGVEVTPGSWHTIIALSSEAIILELKGGPLDPTAKFPAPWAPEEGTDAAASYLEELRSEAG